MLHCAQHKRAAQLQHHRKGTREGVLARDRAASKTAFGCASGASNPPGHEALCFRPCVAIYIGNILAMCTNILVVHCSHAGRRERACWHGIGLRARRHLGAQAAHRIRQVMKLCASDHAWPYILDNILAMCTNMPVVHSPGIRRSRRQLAVLRSDRRLPMGGVDAEAVLRAQPQSV